MNRSADQSVYSRVLAILCASLVVWTLFVLFAGGFTTSIQAGMAFLDWPLSNGSINPPGWTQDQDMLAEHSHRLLAGAIGFFLIPILIVGYRTGQSKTFRRLAWLAVILFFVQSSLGGLRVMLDTLNTGWDRNTVAITFAVIHGCLAQIFFCLLLSLAALASPWWHKVTPERRQEWVAVAREKAFRPAFWVAGLVCVLLSLQLLLGALMRHNGAGLALDGFPHSTSTGEWLPASYALPYALNFSHRIGAVAVTIALAVLIGIIWTHPTLRQRLGVFALALTGLVSWQFFLGVLTILTLKNPHAATFHMLFGAILLATAWLTTLHFWRASYLAGGEIPSPARQTRPVSAKNSLPTPQPALSLSSVKD